MVLMSKPAPVQASERIDILDTTRGIAVLGILLMNITGFGLPFAYEDPTNWGGHAGKNLFVWRVMSLFFEGTMRGLFTLLFGAGVILFLERHRQRDPNASVATLYYRRTVLLIVFGLINGYVLLWDGDILFYYGAIGLFLYFFRNLSIRSLIAAAAIVFAIQVGIGVYEYLDYARVRDVAHDAQYDYRTSSIETEMAINEYEAYQQDFKPSYSQVERTIEVVRESYASAFRYISQRTFFVQTSYFFRHGLGDVLSFMLLGMALLKAGILTGAASRRTYAWFALAGYTLGLTINAFETVSFERADFSVDALMQTYLTYDLGRLPMTLGHVGAIMLMYRYRVFVRAQRVLGAVGRMALTNYLSHSVICLFVFTGAGLALYGQLERYQLYFVVLAIWIAQLIWSPLWLKHFRFGPAEWLWRTLTYGRERKVTPDPRSAARSPSYPHPAHAYPSDNASPEPTATPIHRDSADSPEDR
jgi:uncharacterized protein